MHGHPTPVREKPRRFLGYSGVAVQLHAGQALAARGQQERGDDPVLKTDLRAFHGRAGLGAEPLGAHLLTAQESIVLRLQPVSTFSDPHCGQHTPSGPAARKTKPRQPRCRETAAWSA